MTDTIDLDEMDVDEEGQEGNYGDWLWRDEGDPDGEPGPTYRADATASTGSDDATTDSQRVPGVPRSSDGPAGVPENHGGGRSGERADVERVGTAAAHGVDDPADMTMALTYKAAHHFENPAAVVADARTWADWVGIVGEVSTPAIKQFQHDNVLELDFFGGSETGPAERLADVDESSMFYADRMVLVGTPDDEWMAEQAGWEFVPLTEAAEKADWDLDADLVE